MARACIRCGNTSGYSLIGGSCITCEYDDSDCDELVAEACRKKEDEVVEAIVAWMRKSFRHTIRKEVLDAIENKAWKEE